RGAVAVEQHHAAPGQVEVVVAVDAAVVDMHLGPGGAGDDQQQWKQQRARGLAHGGPSMADAETSMRTASARREVPFGAVTMVTHRSSTSTRRRADEPRVQEFPRSIASDKRDSCAHR